ncbi:hypothetical protein D0962_23125 [Leptolyngbyaceae cyanobacterium CCMR0082]|uniref:Uncharacterized protein n=1 Tax=Adonisia turfae CCMR0082 TaxID=2304604 RepID=A0A6M0SC14_9CYAN|nr:hypothetical protein [Adonisia turfae]NEZ65613.1 hypothetical protein [Adonisia turfae CCMR0082]
MKIVQTTLITLSIIGLAAPVAIADPPGQQRSSSSQTTVTTTQEDGGVVVTTTENPQEMRIRTSNEEGVLDCEAKKDNRGQVILPFECDLSE